MRLTASYLLCAIVGTIAATSTGACIPSEPPTVGRDMVDTAEQTISSDGPFVTTQDLIDYWNSTSTGGARTEIYRNGRNVLERSGFGPAFVKQYFACSDGIRSVCTSTFYDGYVNFDTLVSRCQPNTTIYKDNVLFREVPNSAVYRIVTCYGDQSFYGPVPYYKVKSFDGFVHYGSDCYP